MWFQHILPSMAVEIQTPEVLAAALQPIIYMINQSTAEEFQEFMLIFIKNIFQMPKSVQVSWNFFFVSLNTSTHSFVCA